MTMIKTITNRRANGYAVDMKGDTFDAWNRTSAVAYDSLYLVFATRDEAVAFATEGEEIIPCYWTETEGMDDGAFCVWVEESDE